MNSIPVKNIFPFCMAAATTLVIAMNAYHEMFRSTRLCTVLICLLCLQLIIQSKLSVYREILLYLGLLATMLISLYWTPDLRLAVYTLLPAFNFVFILLLVNSLLVSYSSISVVTGMLSGFLFAMFFYTMQSGFPFIHPAGMSYNAIAGMYYCGLFVTLIVSSTMKSWLPAIIIGVPVLLHILISTSIKFNLAIIAGAAISMIFYVRFIMRLLTPVKIITMLFLFVLFAGISSMGFINNRIDAGLARVTNGIEILKTQKDVPGYSGFSQRQEWLAEGLHGWLEKPVLGHGVESFRKAFGTTSHSTPVDLLYNTGLIGFLFYYAIFFSILIRLFHASKRRSTGIEFVTLGSWTGYLFISTSAAMYYDPFLALFIASSVALLKKESKNEYRIYDANGIKYGFLQ